MREIKFRAWNKITKEYEYPDSWLKLVFPDILTDEDIIVEQWTGLKDKNVKEIYEGSLVKYTEEDGESFIAEVKYFAKDGYPAFDVEPPNEFCFESNVLSVGVANNCLEVVGDVHNNPDLLEVSE